MAKAERERLANVDSVLGLKYWRGRGYSFYFLFFFSENFFPETFFSQPMQQREYCKRELPQWDSSHGTLQPTKPSESLVLFYFFWNFRACKAQLKRNDVMPQWNIAREDCSIGSGCSIQTPEPHLSFLFLDEGSSPPPPNGPRPPITVGPPLGRGGWTLVLRWWGIAWRFCYFNQVFRNHWQWVANLGNIIRASLLDFDDRYIFGIIIPFCPFVTPPLRPLHLSPPFLISSKHLKSPSPTNL